MKEYYVIEPEVAGGWGEHTEFTRTPGLPTTVERLHYCFDGWLGDDILESTPCFIVTERLATEIVRSRLSGVGFKDVMISKSTQFEDLHPNFSLPNFLWMKFDGAPAKDDFGLTARLKLVVSTQALSILKRFQISHAVVGPFDNVDGQSASDKYSV